MNLLKGNKKQVGGGGVKVTGFDNDLNQTL